jgi:hypothetical protein
VDSGRVGGCLGDWMVSKAVLNVLRRCRRGVSSRILVMAGSEWWTLS